MKKIIPFDINRKDATVKYRNGETPLEWHYFSKGNTGYPIYSVKPNTNFETHKKDGSTGEIMTDKWDLVMEVEVEQSELFINFSPKIASSWALGRYDTKKEADEQKHQFHGKLYQLKLTYVQGEKPTVEFIE